MAPELKSTARLSGGSARTAGTILTKNGTWARPRPTSYGSKERVGKAGTRPTFRQTACFDQNRRTA